MEIIIRTAAPGDAAGIAEVHWESWRSAYKGIMPDNYLNGISYEKRFNMWKKIFSAQSNDLYEKLLIFVAADESGKIIGFVSGGVLKHPQDRYKAELGGIYLLRKYQRFGIGSRLIAFFTEALLNLDIPSLRLGVLAENDSRLFYEKLGGQIIREQKVLIGGKDLILLTYGWNDIGKLNGLKKETL
ncbi:MAG: GNAT family N-acetyltransferase [Victivallaceae bacterium]|nr:GNAT family N-acetyltransferase [Victivallaceae bacterium]